MIFKSEITFVKIIFPFIAGIIGAYYFQQENLLYWVSILLFILLFANACANIGYKSLKAWRYKYVISTFYYASFFLLGAFISLFNTHFLHKNYFGNTAYPQLKIWVNDEPQKTNDILRFEANVTQGYMDGKPIASSGKLLIALKLDSVNPVQLSYGDELMITADYQPVEPPYNPAEFDFKSWLATKNIYHQTFINQNQLVNLNQQTGNPLIKYALSVRQNQIATYRKLIKNDEAFAVASTLILGYRADLSKETLSAYTKTGTIHALSVSGMHVGIVYIMLTWILSFLDKRKSTRIIKMVLICSLIWYYSLLTGFSSSVLRAAIMLTVFILAKQFNRNNNTYNILAFTAICLLIYNPFFIWNVGFQLSFLAVFGLVYFQPKIYKWLYVENKWLDKIWSTVALSLAAQLATLPLSIYYFHQFPVYFIISNLFILIPVAVLMYMGIGILLLHAYFLAPIFEWLIVFMNNGLKWIASLPFAGITEIWLDGWQLLLLCTLVILLSIGFAKKRKAYIFLGLGSCLALQLTVVLQMMKTTHQEEMIFFSLRKNYAAAFVNGNQTILVTDLKSLDRNYEFFVKPALDQKGIDNIHFVKWEDEFTHAEFVKRNSQIQFKNKRFLLMDNSFNYKKFSQKNSFDFLWLHNNPKQKMIDLVKEINFDTLILDATNKDYISAKFEQEAKINHLTTFTLKKRKAVALKLN